MALKITTAKEREEGMAKMVEVDEDLFTSKDGKKLIKKDESGLLLARKGQRITREQADLYGYKVAAKAAPKSEDKAVKKSSNKGKK